MSNSLPPTLTAAFDAAGRDSLNALLSGLNYSLLIGDNSRGVEFFLRELSRWLKMKYPESPEDIKVLDKLMVEVYTGIVCHEQVPMSMRSEASKLVCGLIKRHKKRGASATNITLPWKPLFHIVQAIRKKPVADAAKLLSARNRDIIFLIKRARRFFSPDAATELLEACKQKCDISTANDCSNNSSVLELALFTPCHIIGETQSLLSPYFAIWKNIPNNKDVDLALLSLISRILHHNPRAGGSYIAQLFTKILDVFNMVVAGTPLPRLKYSTVRPVDKLILGEGRNNDLHAKVSAKIIALLATTFPNEVQPFVDRLLHTFSTYYQPSNTGFWISQLQTLATSLTSYYSRYASTSSAQIPVEAKAAFTLCILEKTLMTSLFSKSSYLQACSSVMHLCYLAPDTCLLPVLTRAYSAFYTENCITAQPPHYPLCATEIFAVIMHPLLLWPSGDTHLEKIVALTMPGINANDIEITNATLKLYFRLCSLIPMFPEHTASPTNLCQFPLQFLEKIFEFLKTSDGHEAKDVRAADRLFAVLLEKLTLLLFAQLQPVTYDLLLRRLCSFIEYSMPVRAKKEVRILISSCVLANPSKSLPRFISVCKKHILDVNGKLEDQTEDGVECVWFLHMLGAACKYSASYGPDHKEAIISILHNTLGSDNTYIRNAAAKTLKLFLNGLSMTYPLGYCVRIDSMPNDFKWEPHVWSTQPHNSEIKWHIPSKEELVVAEEVSADILANARQSVKDVINQKAVGISKNELLCSALKVVRNIVKGLTVVLSPLGVCSELSDVTFQGLARLKRFRLPSATIVIAHNFRSEISSLLHELTLFLRDYSGEGVIAIQEAIACTMGDMMSNALPRYSRFVGWTYSMLNRKWKTKVPVPKTQAFLVQKAWKRHLMLSTHSSYTAGAYDPQCKKLQEELLGMSFSTFQALRTKAVSALITSVKNYPELVEEVILPPILRVFKEKMGSTREEQEAAIKGALSLLMGSKIICRKLRSQWIFLSNFIESICQSTIYDNQQIQTLIFSFLTVFLSFFEVPYLTAVDVNPLRDMDMQLPLDKASRGMETLEFKKKEDIAALHSTIEWLRLQPLSHWKYKLVATIILGLVSREEAGLGVDSLSWLVNNSLLSTNPLLRSLAVVVIWNMRHSLDKQQIPAEIFSSNVIDALFRYISADRQQLEQRGPQNLPGNVVQELLQSFGNQAKKFGLSFGASITNDEAFELAIVHILYSPKSANWRTMPGFSVKLFQLASASLFKHLACLLGDTFLETCLISLEKLYSSPNESEFIGAQCLFAEVSAGCIKAMSKMAVSPEKASRWHNFLLSNIKQSTPSTVDSWRCALRYIAKGMPYSNISWAVTPLLSTLKSDLNSLVEAGSFQLISNYIQFITAFVIESNDKELHSHVMHLDLAVLLSNPYELVRTQVANLLGILLVKASPDFRLSILAIVRNACDVALVGDKTCEDTVGKGILSLFHSIVDHGWLTYVGDLLPKVISISIKLASAVTPDTSSCARKLLALLGQALKPQVEDFSKTLTAVKSIISSPSSRWHTKNYSLPFLQILTYTHAFVISSGDSTALFDIVVGLLGDPSIEVRLMASQTFGSLLRCPLVSSPLCSENDCAEIRSLISQFSRDASTGVSLDLRHAAVLGLAAIICSFPYSVPHYAPSLVDVLALHVSVKDPIGSTARNALQTFWHTHQEMWHLFQHLFSENQKQILTERHGGNSSSYFA